MSIEIHQCDECMYVDPHSHVSRWTYILTYCMLMNIFYVDRDTVFRWAVVRNCLSNARHFSELKWKQSLKISAVCIIVVEL